MKVFVTGAGGQLGSDMMTELRRRGHEAIGSDISSACGTGDVPLDITDADSVRSTLVQLAPDAVIHCAAWTAVDLAENCEDKVRAVNAGGTRNIAAACREIGCKMVYLSTDYVFNGEGDTPWEADCEDYQPLSVYGKTKLEGEQAVASLLERYFIVRTAWVFGRNGKNFVKTMLGAGRKYDRVRVVCDQIGTPTYTPDLARLLADMIETEQYGYYHATCEGGYISWYDFTCEIFRQAGIACEVIPVTTQEYGLSRAARPHNTRLSKAKLIQKGFSPLPDWRDALRRYLAEIQEIEG